MIRNVLSAVIGWFSSPKEKPPLRGNVLAAALQQPLTKIDFLNRFATTVVDEKPEAIATVVVTKDGRVITLWMGDSAVCEQATIELERRIVAIRMQLKSAPDTTGMTPIDKMYIPAIQEHNEGI